MSRPVAWVTGGGTGIGLGIATALATDGYAVYISGRRSELLQTAADSLNGVEGSMIPLPLDVTDRASVAKARDLILDATDRLDVLVACAGINLPHRSVVDTTPEDWQSIMDINATGAFLCFDAVVPHMIELRRGLIINIASVAGLRALAMAGVAYSASKFAQRALGMAAANELAQHGIRVTNIYPGEVETPILDMRPEPPPPERRAQMVQPDEIGQVVSLIAKLPATCHISELVIKPRYQEYA